MGRVEGKVAFITGAARGQGRAHAMTLAREGASIVAMDLCQPKVGTVEYELATKDDLQETVSLVKEAGGEILALEGDVRERTSCQDVVRQGLEQFGKIDIVCVNAGVWTWGEAATYDPGNWNDTIDVNLNGAWNTVQATLPSMIERGEGGSIILTSSQLALRGIANAVAYCASKAGVVGIMRALAAELAPHSIRVNTVHPSTVYTKMILNDPVYRLFCPDVENPGPEDMDEVLQTFQMLPVASVETEDISNAVLFLASDESRYVTSVTLPVDGGSTQKLG